MTEPEITTVTLQRVRWPLTETDLRELIIAALGGRVGAPVAEEVARSDGVFHWKVEDGRVIGAEIDLTIESPIAPPVTIVEAEPIEAPSFRGSRVEVPQTVDAQAVLVDAKVGAQAPEVTVDPHLHALIAGAKPPARWSLENDLELFDLAISGHLAEDIADQMGRSAAFLEGRFNLLTGKKSGGPIFPREVVRDALALICGEGAT